MVGTCEVSKEDATAVLFACPVSQGHGFHLENVVGHLSRVEATVGVADESIPNSCGDHCATEAAQC